MKVVLDTNVLISGILWKGNEAKVVKKCQTKALQNYVSKDIFSEFIRVISYPKFGLQENEIKAAANMIARLSTFVKPKCRFQIIKKDPMDNKFLDCAYEAEARYIISGDEHLIGLGIFRDIQILSAKTFLKKL
ncbi:MAG: putative toxin-antitoxin system toxin component, PIN family [Candidatus Hydrothermarchaeaceae archaeon]